MQWYTKHILWAIPYTTGIVTLYILQQIDKGWPGYTAIVILCIVSTLLFNGLLAKWYGDKYLAADTGSE